MNPLRLIGHPAVRPEKANFECSFCFKSRIAVRHLIAGPGIVEANPMICNECVELCVDLIEAESVERP